MARKTKNIAVPRELYSEIDKKLIDTDIDTVEEYVLFVMEQLLKDDDQLQLTREDDEQIRKKLKDLGYLD